MILCQQFILPLLECTRKWGNHNFILLIAGIRRWMAKHESFCSWVVGDVVWNSSVSFFFSINCWQKKILVNIEHSCLWVWILVCMYSSLDMGALFDFHYQAEVIQKTFHLLFADISLSQLVVSKIRSRIIADRGKITTLCARITFL